MRRSYYSMLDSLKGSMTPARGVTTIHGWRLRFARLRMILLQASNTDVLQFIEWLRLPRRDDSKAIKGLQGPRLERAIGVIYLPQSERVSHYFQARLPEQFDAIIHFDETQAVEPLDRTEI